MDKSSKKQPVTLESLAQTMAAGFSTLDKKIDSKFEVLDKKIDRKFGILDKKIDTKFGILDKKIDTKFGILDKKIDTKFGILDKKIDAVDKKIDDTSEQLLIKMQQGFLEQIERIECVERSVTELKAGQARIETNLAGAARNIDLMDLRAEVEILKRKV
ncbi:MAG TPA: hypothetical protein PKK37_01325 [Candidatus Pacearchaeota archaeon]|nr:hypothetical protein [Candidatus Pacearchaeota archaeon]